MNRHQDDILNAIARLGDHMGRIQLLLRNLAESRDLDDDQIDPETDLAVTCWLEEVEDLVGLPRDLRTRKERPQY